MGEMRQLQIDVAGCSVCSVDVSPWINTVGGDERHSAEERPGGSSGPERFHGCRHPAGKLCGCSFDSDLRSAWCLLML